MSITQIATPTSATALTSYEYLTVKALRHNELELADTYRSFGWTLEQSDAAGVGSPTIFLRFKRDRHIKNRPMIDDLQRTATTALNAAEELDRTKTRKAMLVALSTGLLGTVLLAVSVFLLIGSATFLSWVLGIFGLIFWALSPLLYRQVATKSAQSAGPKIAKQRDVAYGAMENSIRLLG
ncbi:hypothetical protein [Lysinibacter cavernae]|uniref:DUF2812 domain-containing protein n=1 Tax=Lysinibacter cavernae TaxID=1640652 RepID=A0A7X5R3H6_9MICO|nr:hypothetical protein [Lysinibacter cavernae]NIH54707.1 hypothetical protein [Lysinibacter cavernae]